AGADQPGVAALGDHRDAFAIAQGEHGGDLVVVRRSDDHRTPPGPSARPVGLVTRSQVVVAECVIVADDRGDGRSLGGRQRGGGWPGHGVELGTSCGARACVALETVAARSPYTPVEALVDVWRTT